MKTKHFFIVLAAVAVCFTACKKDEKATPVTGITLNYEELTLIPGDTITLIATVQPNGATNKTVTWTSSKPGVVTVNEEGLITAVTNGEATITAATQDGNKIVTCIVTVDFRSQWVGDWDFVVVRDCWLFDGEHSINTYYCLGTTIYGDTSNQLYVEYQNISLLMDVEESGKLSYHDYNEDAKGQIESNGTVHIVYKSSGLAYSCTHTIDGTKKEGDKK